MKNVIKSLTHPDVLWFVSIVVIGSTIVDRLKNPVAEPIFVLLSPICLMYLAYDARRVFYKFKPKRG